MKLMAEKRDTGFTVTDRRLFTADGDLRKDAPEEVEVSKSPVEAKREIAPEKPETNLAGAAREDMPQPPTSAEQQAQKDAYAKLSKELDARVELSGHSAKELEVTFERFMASLYMTAMLQLGLMREEGGQPRVDVIGARQSIDTLTMISDKTKGNLTTAEEAFLQNVLYELRMAYVEVTNSLARPPQPGPSAAPKSR